jgi:hypothetical protein
VVRNGVVEEVVDFGGDHDDGGYSRRLSTTAVGV